MTGQRGIAMIMALLFTAFLSALGLGLLLAVFMDRLATGNLAGSLAMLYAADAGIELAARDLAQAADWDAVLTGSEPSSFTDGASGGVRGLPGGGEVDLSVATNLLNCGRPTNCSTPQMTANSRDRPWGANNPRWQLYVYGPMERLLHSSRPAPCYLAVWIADDGREDDDDPLADAVEAGDPGHGIVRVRSETFGAAGSRRVIEAELVRACPGDTGGQCPLSIRVQSWQELRQPVP